MAAEDQNSGDIQKIANVLLVEAIMKDNSLNCVKIAISLGAELNSEIPVTIVDDKDGSKKAYGVLPLMGALIRKGIDEEIIELLIKSGADAGYDARRRTGPIFIASNKCSLGIVRMILDTGMSPDQVDRDGLSPLSYSIIAKRLDTSIMLLDEYHADPDYSGPRKTCTPLIIAIENENYPAIQLLLERGANVNRADFEGLTALHAVAVSGISATAAMLLKPELSPDMSAMSNSGYTPLITAILNDNLGVAAKFLDANADINQASASGMTPLMYAILRGQTGFAKYLLLKGADPFIADANGHDSLYYANRRENIDIIEILRDKFNERYRSGTSPPMLNPGVAEKQDAPEKKKIT